MANEGKKKGTLIKDTAILFVITLISGLLLGLVYDITAPIIQERRDADKASAFASVFNGAMNVVEDEALSGKVSEAEAIFAAREITGMRVDSVLKALGKEEETIGYVVTVTTSKGYKGDITLTLGYSLDGKVTGLEFLTLNETAGLGSKVADEAFAGQFIDKQVEKFKLSAGSNPEDVAAVTAATVSSEAVVGAINAAMAFVQDALIAQ